MKKIFNLNLVVLIIALGVAGNSFGMNTCTKTLSDSESRKKYIKKLHKKYVVELKKISKNNKTITSLDLSNREICFEGIKALTPEPVEEAVEDCADLSRNLPQFFSRRNLLENDIPLAAEELATPLFTFTPLSKFRKK